MTTEEIKALTISQKLQIMEAIWADLRDHFEHVEAAPQLKELLDQRRGKVRDGSARLLDWDLMKSTIGRP